MEEVKVYSTPTCYWCGKLKMFLKNHNIQFKDINVAESEDDAIEIANKTGQIVVPVIDINGKIIIGFNKPEIVKELKIMI